LIGVAAEAISISGQQEKFVVGVQRYPREILHEDAAGGPETLLLPFRTRGEEAAEVGLIVRWVLVLRKSEPCLRVKVCEEALRVIIVEIPQGEGALEVAGPNSLIEDGVRDRIQNHRYSCLAELSLEDLCYCALLRRLLLRVVENL
jgi:hypothetical protein